LTAPLRVLIAFGTRPEAIKMAPVVRALQARPGAFVVRACATAQHREMLDQVLSLFGIRPDVDVDVMRPAQGLSGLAARVLSALDPLLVGERPDWVLSRGTPPLWPWPPSPPSTGTCASLTSRPACAPATAATPFRKR